MIGVLWIHVTKEGPKESICLNAKVSNLPRILFPVKKYD
jgi:hypothetical protein